MKLNQLPNEILIEIFEMLPTSDLIALTQVCYRFNVLINNSILSSKFTLNLDQESANRAWIGTRKYTNIHITTNVGIFSVLSCVAADIKKITFELISIDLKSVARILILCPEVKEVTFKHVKTHSYLNLSYQELPKHDNFKLWIENTTPNTLEIFKHVKIVKLTIIGPTRTSDFDICWKHSDCGIGFSSFLLSQTKLIDLTLKDFRKSISIFNDRSFDHVPFRLRKLTLSNFYAQNLNLLYFMSNQITTIKSLKIIPTKCMEQTLKLISRYEYLMKR